VALTAQGFDTRGSDGVLGPRSREMLAAWQKARSMPATGYVDATQQARLLREAAAAVGKFDDEQKMAEDQKKAEDDRKKAEEEARKRTDEAVKPALPKQNDQPAQWRARDVLIENRSLATCKGSNSSVFSLELSGDVLTVSTMLGDRAAIKVSPDGSFSQDVPQFRGSRMKAEGNVRTKEIELISIDRGCRWRLVPDWLKMRLPAMP
jgi:hypothetical protein